MDETFISRKIKFLLSHVVVYLFGHFASLKRPEEEKLFPFIHAFFESFPWKVRKPPSHILFRVPIWLPWQKYLQTKDIFFVYVEYDEEIRKFIQYLHERIIFFIVDCNLTDLIRVSYLILC